MITWEELVFSALFSSLCIIGVVRKAPVSRVGGEGARKDTDRTDVAPSLLITKCSVTSREEKEQQ